MALMIGCAGWTQSAHANVYATNVRLNGGITNFTAQPGESVTIDYLLNEPASGGVTVNITAGSTVVRAITVPAGASGSLGGANTVLWDGLDNSSNNVAGGTYSISVTARSVGYTSWTHLTSLDPADPNTYVFSGRGIAVDRNASSAASRAWSSRPRRCGTRDRNWSSRRRSCTRTPSRRASSRRCTRRGSNPARRRCTSSRRRARRGPSGSTASRGRRTPARRSRRGSQPGSRSRPGTGRGPARTCSRWGSPRRWRRCTSRCCRRRRSRWGSSG